MGPLFFFPAFFCLFSCFFSFFLFFCSFLHFLFFKMFFIFFFHFFPKKKFLLSICLYFFHICFIAGISIREKMFPP